MLCHRLSQVHGPVNGYIDKQQNHRMDLRAVIYLCASLGSMSVEKGQ